MYLGIETSCDDTAIAIINGKDVIINERIVQNHQQYGGVFPAQAASQHIINLPVLFNQIDKDYIEKLSHIAVTIGPGLKQCLLSGISFAQGLSIRYQLPIQAVHHIEAHILSVELSENIKPPYIALIISGGHTLIVDVYKYGKYKILGSSIDDALGECFDKCGRHVDLSYPAGPIMEKLALEGNEYKFILPKPMYDSNCYNMSFSGLKTHVLHNKVLYKEYIRDFCASFHRAISDILIKKLKNIVKDKLVICGGVAANRIIYHNLSQYFDVYTTIPALCTDNAAMIAYTGSCMKRNIDISVKPIWSIEDL